MSSILPISLFLAADQTRRVIHQLDKSHGLYDRVSDYLCYYPYSTCLVYSVSAHLESHIELPHPSGYPTGFLFVESDWDAKAVSEAKIGVNNDV